MEEITDARAQLNDLIAAMPKRQVLYKDGESKEVDARPEHLTSPHPKHPFWLDLCRNPRVLDAEEQVLVPDLILIMSYLIVKRAGDGLQVAWYQDNTYLHSVQGEAVTTVWLAVDDTDQANLFHKIPNASHLCSCPAKSTVLIPWCAVRCMWKLGTYHGDCAAHPLNNMTVLTSAVFWIRLV